MGKDAKLVFLAIVLLTVVFVVPLIPASANGGVMVCNSQHSCAPSRVHFTQSIDCYLLGAGPGQWIGVYYFDGELGFACGPLIS